MVVLESAGLSHQGWVRTRNEDCLLILEELGIFAVADGLGGLPGGAESSELALALVSQMVRIQRPKTDDQWYDFLNHINEVVCQQMFESFHNETGCTLSLLSIQGDAFQLCQVGDSAIFMRRDGHIRVLSEEHTVAARKARLQETISPRDHHVLTQCIGQNVPLEPQISSGFIEAGDCFLLSTDGLHRMIPLNRLSMVLGEPLSPLEKIEKLFSQVLQRDAPDNLTGIVIETRNG